MLRCRIVSQVELVTPVVFNLIIAVAHFNGSQIFVAHFHKNFEVIVTMSLG